MKFVSALAVILCFALEVTAQIFTTVEISSTYGDNVAHALTTQNDFANKINLELGWQPENQPVYFYFAGDLNSYNKNNHLNYSDYSAGFDYSRSFGAKNIIDFYAGGELAARSKNGIADINNYRQADVQSDLQFNLNLVTLRTGYEFRFRNYENLAQQSNYLHTGYAQFNKSFQTGTSLTVEANYGQKIFSGNLISSGKTDMHRFLKPFSNQTPISRNLSHFGLVARLAQSLHPRVGLFLEYSNQLSLQKSVNLNLNPYLLDDELFDDPFSYDYNKLKSQLRILFSKSFELMLSGSLNRKDYSNTETTDALSTNRIDNQQRIDCQITKRFYFSTTQKALTLNVNFDYLNNESNHPWYNYSGAAFGVGFNWSL